MSVAVKLATLDPRKYLQLNVWTFMYFNYVSNGIYLNKEKISIERINVIPYGRLTDYIWVPILYIIVFILLTINYFINNKLKLRKNINNTFMCIVATVSHEDRSNETLQVKFVNERALNEHHKGNGVNLNSKIQWPCRLILHSPT